jgi:hypothetical protein
VIRVKAHPASTGNVMQVLMPLLSGREPAQFANHLVIASSVRIRWIATTG